MQGVVPTGDEVVQNMIGGACFNTLSSTPDGKKALALLTKSFLATAVTSSTPSSRSTASSRYGPDTARNDGPAYAYAQTPVHQKNGFRSLAGLSPLVEGGASVDGRYHGDAVLNGTDFGPDGEFSLGPSRNSTAAAAAFTPGSAGRPRSTPRASHDRIGNPGVQRLLAKESSYRLTNDTISELSRFEMDAEDHIRQLKDEKAEVTAKIKANASFISGRHIEINSLKAKIVSEKSIIKETEAATVDLEDKAVKLQKDISRREAEMKGYQADQMVLSDRAAREGHEIKVLQAELKIDEAADDGNAGMFVGVKMQNVREAHGIFKPHDVVTKFTGATEDGPAYDRILAFNRMLVKGKANLNGEYLAMWSHDDWSAKFETVGEWKTGKMQNGDHVTLNQWYALTASRLFLEIFESVNDLRKASGLELGDAEKYGTATYSGPVWK